MSHSHKSRYVKRLSRSIAARFDRLHPKLDFNCMNFKSNMAIRAVQICVFTAFGEVPTKVLTCRFCFSALKKSSICHLSL